MKIYSLFIFYLALLLVFFSTALAYNTKPTSRDTAQPEEKKPIKILIVPGHDNQFSGAVFNGVREADLNLELAKKLVSSLAEDTRLYVTIARDDSGYIPILKDYLVDNAKGINEFIDKHKKETNDAINSGEIEIGAQVPHNNSLAAVAYQLYGINKWATEENFDLIVHIHFNDSWPRWPSRAGEYEGYTVYVPHKELLDPEPSRELGEAIGSRLHRSFFASNLPAEENKADDTGVVEDFKLIALGASRTLSLPRVLVEYSYIYEPILSKQFFPLTSDVMIRATDLGIHKYLFGEEKLTKSLTYHWSTNLAKSSTKKIDTLALQYGLHELGYYPLASMSREKCPATGRYGDCTKTAVQNFQKVYKLSADGIVGPATRSKLNAMFAN